MTNNLNISTAGFPRVYKRAMDGTEQAAGRRFAAPLRCLQGQKRALSAVGNIPPPLSCLGIAECNTAPLVLSNCPPVFFIKNFFDKNIYI